MRIRDIARIDGFPCGEYNAVTDLINEVILAGDTAFGGEILTSLSELRSAATVAAEDEENLNAAIENLTIFTT